MKNLIIVLSFYPASQYEAGYNEMQWYRWIPILTIFQLVNRYGRLMPSVFYIPEELSDDGSHYESEQLEVKWPQNYYKATAGWHFPKDYGLERLARFCLSDDRKNLVTPSRSQILKFCSKTLEIGSTCKTHSNILSFFFRSFVHS